MAAFSWTVAKIDVLQVRRRRSYRYGEQRTIFISVRRRPTTSLRPATPAQHACTSHAHVHVCSTIRIILDVSCMSDRSARVQYVYNIPTLITLQLILRAPLLQCGACKS